MRTLPATRRHVLKALGVAIPAVRSVRARPETRLYRTPPSSAETATVPVRQQTHHIPDDAWIAHTFGYRTEGDEDPAALVKVRDAATYEFTLNGTEVTDFHRGWKRVTSTDHGYLQEWRYIVPPQSSGEHRYALEITFDDPVRTSGSSARVWEGTYRFTGSYTVGETETGSRLSSRCSRDRLEPTHTPQSHDDC